MSNKYLETIHPSELLKKEGNVIIDRSVQNNNLESEIDRAANFLSKYLKQTRESRKLTIFDVATEMKNIYPKLKNEYEGVTDLAIKYLHSFERANGIKEALNNDKESRIKYEMFGKYLSGIRLYEDEYQYIDALIYKINPNKVFLTEIKPEKSHRRHKDIRKINRRLGHA